MGCFDDLTGGFAQNCDRPTKSGLRSKGLIMNVEDIDHWVISGAANQFLPVMKAGKVAFPIDVLGSNPFTGTNVASANDEFQRSFTKTVVFNIPVSGSAAALKVEQLTKSQAGFVVTVEGKDAGGDLNGTFMIFGKDEPLLCTVAKDYVAGVSAPIITATSIEKGYENFLFMTDLATTKTAFDVLYAADLTKRLYFLEFVNNAGALDLHITLLSGTAPATALYTLMYVAFNSLAMPLLVSTTPNVFELDGEGIIETGLLYAEVFATAALAETIPDVAGTAIYFVANHMDSISTIPEPV